MNTAGGGGGREGWTERGGRGRDGWTERGREGWIDGWTERGGKRDDYVVIGDGVFVVIDVALGFRWCLLPRVFLR